MGYRRVASLRSGLHGWKDYDQPLYNVVGEQMEADVVDKLFSPPITAEKLGPN